MKWNKGIFSASLVILLAGMPNITGCNQTAGGTQSMTNPPASYLLTDTTTTPESPVIIKTLDSKTTTTSLYSIQMVRDITAVDAYKLIQENKGNPNFIIIDIRTTEEYETGHLENAVLIDFYADNFRDEISKLDKNKTYLEYCRTARRSTLALEIFKELGFKDVLNMTGGITEWTAKGFPVAK